jgi:hypothetical protein
MFGSPVTVAIGLLRQCSGRAGDDAFERVDFTQNGKIR